MPVVPELRRVPVDREPPRVPVASSLRPHRVGSRSHLPRRLVRRSLLQGLLASLEDEVKAWVSARTAERTSRPNLRADLTIDASPDHSRSGDASLRLRWDQSERPESSRVRVEHPYESQAR